MKELFEVQVVMMDLIDADSTVYVGVCVTIALC